MKEVCLLIINSCLQVVSYHVSSGGMGKEGVRMNEGRKCHVGEDILFSYHTSHNVNVSCNKFKVE